MKTILKVSDNEFFFFKMFFVITLIFQLLLRLPLFDDCFYFSKGFPFPFKVFYILWTAVTTGDCFQIWSSFWVGQINDGREKSVPYFLKHWSHNLDIQYMWTYTLSEKHTCQCFYLMMLLFLSQWRGNICLSQALLPKYSYFDKKAKLSTKLLNMYMCRRLNSKVIL